MKTYRVLINMLASNGEVAEVKRHAVQALSLRHATATAWGIAAQSEGLAFVASVEPIGAVMVQSEGLAAVCFAEGVAA